MILRPYTREDSPIIASWLRTERELYQWSADRYGIYPLPPYKIDENYIACIKETNGRFFPLTGVDENGQVVAHIIIRYPNPTDDTRLRLGFVIVDPTMRGKGYGKELCTLALAYIKEHFGVKYVELGVFENNESALKCYQSVGFEVCGTDSYETPYGVWKDIELEMKV